ncbi:unnamed protein product [Acanthoscelides obtectus]|nr:unnamed protein product [Acanthoscelides obtectus]CAK1621234.1 hypothetical protein AOBTE_LOCUS848 [Acanthoscelides obtectus]
MQQPEEMVVGGLASTVYEEGSFDGAGGSGGGVGGPMMMQQQQQPPPVRTYDDLFPALPDASLARTANRNPMGAWVNKMRVGSSKITHVFR